MKSKNESRDDAGHRAPNWFEGRSAVIILSLCRTIEKLGVNFREQAPYLEQALFESVRLYNLSCRHAHPPSLSGWMHGDTSENPEIAIAELQKLIANPGAVAQWLEASSRNTGVLPPNEWGDSRK
jgi:hypothetical protein